MPTLSGIFAFLTSPAGTVALGGVVVVGTLAARVLIRTSPEVAAYAQDLADLNEEVQVWVEEADRLNLPGANKAASVSLRFEEWMQAEGIKGQRGRVLAKYLPVLREVAVKKLGR